MLIIMIKLKCNTYVIMDSDFFDFNQDDESPPPVHLFHASMHFKNGFYLYIYTLYYEMLC